MRSSSAAVRDSAVCRSHLERFKHGATLGGWIRACGRVGILTLALLDAVGLAQPAAAAVANVQSAAQVPVSANTLSVTFSAAQSAGDLNVVAVGWNNSTSAVNSVTDSKGNTYQVAVGPTIIAGNGTQVLYYAQNIAAAAAGANTVTVTFNTTVANPDVRILEYSGISTTAALDVAVGASGTGTAVSSGAITTTNPNDLLVGANYIGTGFAGVGAGYTERMLTNPDEDLVEDEVVTATGSYSATSTQAPSSWWVMQMAAFRVASGGGGDTTPPTAPSNLVPNAISSSQINLGWTASTDNVGVTGYRIERCQGVGCTSFAQINTSTTTAYSDTGLTASTSYSYRVRATDAAGNLSGYSNIATTSTLSGSSVTVANVQSAAQVPVSANTLSVTFSAAQSAGDLNVVAVGWNNSTSAVNSVTDSKGNTYQVAVGPTIIAGNGTQVLYYAQNIAAAAAGANTVTVTFNTTVANPDVRILEYSGISTTAALDVAVGASGTGTAVSSGAITTTNPNDLLVGANYIGTGFAGVGAGYTERMLTNPDEDLVEDEVVTATGSYSATSTQAPSSWWVMQMAAFRVASGGGGDTTPPTAPSNLVPNAISSSQINLGWTASTDNVGVTGYRIERCQGVGCTSFAQINTSTTTAYSDTGLTASTSYSYRVRATDAAGNLSGYSNIATTSTLSGGDTTPPTAPSNLVPNAISSSQINLGWTASTDNVGVTGYRIERCQGVGCTSFAQINTSTTTAYSDTGLTASTSYSYRVRATDAAGNLSGYSNIATTSTLSGSSVTVANVQSAAQVPVSANTLSVTFSAAQSAGDLNVVAVGWNNSTSAVNSVTDSKGNTYQVAVGPTIIAGNGTQVLYYAQNIAAAAAGANTVTVTFNTTVANPDVRILEYSGISTTAALDVAVGASGTGTAVSSGAITTTNPNDLLVGANYIGTGFAGVGAGYTERMLTNPDEDLVEDEVVTATGSYSATSTQAPSSWWVMQMAAFRSASGGSFSTITPRNAALTLLQTQQFTTNAPGGTTLNWSVDGVAGGNSSVGTISGSGLYTPPAGAGMHTVSATNAANSANSVSVTVAVTNLTGVTTYHNDLARTGQNLQEYALTPVTVSGGTFGKRWSCPLDATAYAQPLYVANLAIGGGTHNVLFVATMNDSLYAFDADNPGCVIYWKASFINGTTITPQSSAAAGCGDNPGTYGITGTPVIDPVGQMIYLVTATTENGTYVQRLHGLTLATGAEPTTAAVIQAAVPGDSGGGTSVVFNSLYQNQRPGLVLTPAGGIVIGWGSHCDNGAWPWHGWVMVYDAGSLTQSAVFNDTPNGTDGGIWMSGGAPALDAEGNMFLSTGNGSFDATTGVAQPPAPNNDYGESFLNLSPSSLAVQDFYTPSQNVTWTTDDLDIAAGGITVLPDGVGPSAHPNVLVGLDKQGHLWMIDRMSMSGFSPTADNTVQYLTMPGATAFSVHSSPAYWNGTVYAAVGKGPVLAFQLSNGLIPQGMGLAVASSQSAETYAYPDPTPVISASPSGNAIVWVLDNNANGTDNGSSALGPAILRAYNATNLGTTLYSSATLPADVGGDPAKYVLPVVANGHVYVVGYNSLTVYGLAP